MKRDSHGHDHGQEHCLLLVPLPAYLHTCWYACCS
jgi:hypothetical protein